MVLKAMDKAYICEALDSYLGKVKHVRNFSLYDIQSYKIAVFDSSQEYIGDSGFVRYEKTAGEHVFRFNIPSNIMGYDVVDLADIARIAMQSYIPNNAHIECVTLDFRECDLSNLIWADSLFDVASSKIAVKLPNGEKTLRPTSMWRYTVNTEVVNIEDVIKNTDFSHAINTHGMLSGCSTVRELDFRGKKFNELFDTEYMFYNCYNLKHIWFDKGQLAGVSKASSMFAGCSNLKEFNLDCFDGAFLTDMSAMFWGCANLTSVKLAGGWESIANNKIKLNMAGMFKYCIELTDLDTGGIMGLLGPNSKTNEIFGSCENLVLRNLRVVNDSKKIVEETLVATGRNTLDIRGTRLITRGGEVAISLIGNNETVNKHFIHGGILILDGEQYYQNKESIDWYINKNSSDIIICNSEELEITSLKLKCFGIHNLKGLLIIVDLDYDYNNFVEICVV